MVRRLARIVGLGVETTDLLVHELLSRPMRDRRAVARYAGLIGSSDESGARRREQGLARAGNAPLLRCPAVPTSICRGKGAITTKDSHALSCKLAAETAKPLARVLLKTP